MSPITLAGVGWLLSTLGFGGFLGGFGGLAALLGYGAMAYGLHQIRWRGDWLGRGFWLVVAALVLLLLIIFGLLFDRAQVYTLALTQAAIAFSVARGVRDCLAPAGQATGKLRALTVTSFVIALTTVATVVVDALAVAGVGLPTLPLALLVFASGLGGIVFGGLLLAHTHEPALQAHS